MAVIAASQFFYGDFFHIRFDMPVLGIPTASVAINHIAKLIHIAKS